MPIKRTLQSRVPVKIWTEDVASNAMDQLKNTASLPFVYHHVAAMPDVHLGIGATVGSVVATVGAVMPASVGVDIGCGMMWIETGLDIGVLDGKLPELRHSIERGVPVGFNSHKEPKIAAQIFGKNFGRPIEGADDDELMGKSLCQLGSLGGGNHFIEVCVNLDTNKLSVMLHSGSRNVGKTVAERYINKAKLHHLIKLPDPELAYFAAGTDEFANYVNDVQWCQMYAMLNRQIMMDEVLKDLAHLLGVDRYNAHASLGVTQSVNCHHNYIAEEIHFGQKVFVTRKGAINAEKGTWGIIPGSMGTGSFIVKGLGNPESFNSAPHGAGRRMSRGEAKRTFTVADLEAQTSGVECRKDADVLDEAPAAYKDIGEVITNSSDLVTVEARIKQVLCVKG